MNTQNKEETRSVSSVSITYEGEEETKSKQPILTVSDIPTLRSLYRTHRILQRDQSYAPNDVYNQTICLCNYDLTRLKVDAIVNSANSAMKITRSPETLNYAVHKAGGPALTEEAKSKGKAKPGQVKLTHGHNLPSAWVIHASRPHYSHSKGMGLFNVLTECYRSALKMAANYEFKTIAFPCLGAGGCGFPPRVAARIALQEIREYLDAQPDHHFERIIFCVNSAIDEKIYLDWLAVFFPPTHGDLEVARNTTKSSAKHAAPASKVLETRARVQKLFDQLSADFSLLVPDFDEAILTELSSIDAALAAIRGFLLGPTELNRGLSDLNLICSVMNIVCGSVTKVIDQANVTTGSAPKHQSLWHDYNTNMKATYGTEFLHFLVDCQNFVQCLADILTLDGVELEEMSGMRRRLESYEMKQDHQDAEGVRKHLDEVLYTREFQRETVTHTREVVRLHQIPSVTRLYQIGALEEKTTLAQPSVIFNHTVCLAREDITKLEVDVLVNSTDVSFLGMGTLDRSVFKQGGSELREQIKKFGKCNVGDVKLTPGYKLPVKHILHVIPPQQYTKNGKLTLRKIYREILHTAVLMRATSIAIPSIGTGMLNYPRRDCASVALEEVKYFLESAEPSNLLEKIVFVVYSSNDEFVYKSLLPMYFPPKEHGTRPTPVRKPSIHSDTQPVELMGDSPSPRPSPTPRRSLFGSIGDALRSVRFGKQTETSRPINSYEEHDMIGFESHATDCIICKDINRLYLEGRDLCETGYPLAQRLLWHMDMSQDQNVYSKPDNTGKRVRLEVPADLFPLSLNLLTVVEKSFRDESQTRPFVSPNRRLGAEVQSQVQERAGHSGDAKHAVDATETMPVSTSLAPARSQAEVAIWTSLANRWDPVSPGECNIHIYPGKVDIYNSDDPTEDTVPLLSLELTPITLVHRHATNTELVLSGAPQLKSVLERTGDVIFRSNDAATSEALLKLLQDAIGFNPEYPESTVPIERERVPYSGPEAQPEDTYPQWNQRLHEIRSGLASGKDPMLAKDPREGRLSPLQIKLQNLSGASNRLRSISGERANRPAAHEQSVFSPPSVPASEPSTSTKEISRDMNSSPLATLILEHLTLDLTSRPGSYIGQHTRDIAFALQKSEADISAAIEELATQRKVHNTIDVNTWVISYTPKDLPPLSQQQRQSGTKDQPADSEQDLAIDLLATKTLAYMKYVNYAPRNKNGQTIREIASALQKPTSEIWPVIRELAARGDIQQSSDAETWVVTELPQNVLPEVQESSRSREQGRIEDAELSINTLVRDAPNFNDIPTSPITPIPPSEIPTAGVPKSYIDLDLNTGNIDEYFSYPSSFGQRWTRIDKLLVDPQVLIEAEEEFDDTGDSLIVHRVLRRGEIRRWAERTMETRKWRTLTEDIRKRRAERTGVGSASRADERKRDGKRASQEVREQRAGWRDGRGEKDRKQTQLDRMLAGDMKEDELRHFTEDEGRRFE